jgi:hypothetical protein
MARFRRRHRPVEVEAGAEVADATAALLTPPDSAAWWYPILDWDEVGSDQAEETDADGSDQAADEVLALGSDQALEVVGATEAEAEAEAEADATADEAAEGDPDPEPEPEPAGVLPPLSPGP